MLLVALGALGCVVAPIDPEGRECPCDQGWICDTSRTPNLCVRELGLCTEGASVCGGRSGDRICDGWEREGLGATWELVDSFGPGSSEIVRVANRGCSALECSLPDDGSRHYVEHDFDTPVRSGSLYARVWLWLDPETPLDDFVSVMFLGEPDEPWEGLSVQLEDGPSITLASEPSDVRDPVPFTAGRWTCVEVGFEIASPGRVTLWLDGEEVSSSEGDLSPAGGIGLLAVGAVHAGDGQGALRLRIDDVVLDDAPIGCD